MARTQRGDVITHNLLNDFDVRIEKLEDVLAPVAEDYGPDGYLNTEEQQPIIGDEISATTVTYAMPVYDETQTQAGTADVEAVTQVVFELNTGGTLTLNFKNPTLR